MIASINGIVLSKSADGVVVDVNGVGYHVHVPLRSLSEIPNIGEKVFLHTYTNVREDAIQLFGFLTDKERRLFVTLIGVNGIGPKLSLTILSGMPVERFMEAIHNEDVHTLTRIPGLGKKTAQRLILELKGRLPLTDTAVVSSDGTSILDDAVSALINLGYKRQESEMVVRGVMDKGLSSIEDIIREALRHLTEGWDERHT
ncbi:MAG: Holliday junction branch migration protein RuvA [Thermodesulfovibrionia bacterium]